MRGKDENHSDQAGDFVKKTQKAIKTKHNQITYSFLSLVERRKGITYFRFSKEYFFFGFMNASVSWRSILNGQVSHAANARVAHTK